jgi:hypothetical protein
MNKAIIVGTRPDRKKWLNNCLKSIDSKYSVVVVNCEGYEVGKMKWVLNNTDIDRFVFLQDSIEVKDNSVFECLDKYTQGVSLCSYPRLFGCYFGCYNSWALRKINLPDIDKKLTAVQYEMIIHKDYSNYDEIVDLGKDLVDNDIFIKKFGKKVMKLENKYFIKYKSHWSQNGL